MNNIAKIIIVLLILGLAVGAYMFLPGLLPSEESKTIKIVTSFPMRKIEIGKEIVNGIKLAFDEVNYEVDGHEIELVIEDDGNADGAWTEYLEADIAERSAEDDQVLIYLGTYNSGAAKISIPITNKAGLVQISPGNTWPGLTRAGFAPGEPGIFYPTGIRSYFRVCPNDAVQGPAGAIWAKEKGFNSVYIFDDGESYGAGVATIFEEKAKEIGLDVVGHVTIDKKADDFTEELEAIKDEEIDLIYFGGVTPNGAVPLAKGIKDLGIGAAFMGPDGIMEQGFIDQAGDAAEGVFMTVVGMPAKELTGKGKEFYDKYKQTYGLEPGVFSGFGYEAAKISILAIESSEEKTRENIMEEVSKIRNYDGVFGKWSFGSSGDTTLSLVSGNIVRNGEFVFETILT